MSRAPKSGLAAFSVTPEHKYSTTVECTTTTSSASHYPLWSNSAHSRPVLSPPATVGRLPSTPVCVQSAQIPSPSVTRCAENRFPVVVNAYKSAMRGSVYASTFSKQLARVATPTTWCPAGSSRKGMFPNAPASVLSYSTAANTTTVLCAVPSKRRLSGEKEKRKRPSETVPGPPETRTRP